MTIEDASKYLKVSKYWLFNLCRKGRIKAKKIRVTTTYTRTSLKWDVTQEAVNDYLERFNKL